MPETSAILSLPLLMPAQAQKHVTHNEALVLLDALVQLSVAGAGDSVPPAQPAAGARYLVGPGATGAWAGQDQNLALYDGAAWRFLTPLAGWIAEWPSQGLTMVFDGAAWIEKAPDLNNLDGVGIGTSADAVNRLAVASGATLLSHAGAGHQLKINKAASGDTASLLFQSDWSGRAEMGLNGSDAWSVKVSPDGSTWLQALVLDPLTGQVSGGAVQSAGYDAAAGLLLKTGAGGLLGYAASPDGGAPYETLTGAQFIGDGVSAAPSDKPQGGRAHAGIHVATTSSRWMQILAQTAKSGTNQEGHIWFRTADGGVTEPWQLLFSPRNVVRPVAQTNGVPDADSGLIEQGENANGAYTRFADGTQICSHVVNLGSRVTTGAGSLANPYRTDQLSWTYPAGFGTAPAVTATGEIDTTSGAIRAHSMSLRGVGAAGVDYVQAAMLSSDAADVDVLVHLTAIGRWY